MNLQEIRNILPSTERRIKEMKDQNEKDTQNQQAYTDTMYNITHKKNIAQLKKEIAEMKKLQNVALESIQQEQAKNNFFSYIKGKYGIVQTSSDEATFTALNAKLDNNQYLFFSITEDMLDNDKKILQTLQQTKKQNTKILNPVELLNYIKGKYRLNKDLNLQGVILELNKLNEENIYHKDVISFLVRDELLNSAKHSNGYIKTLEVKQLVVSDAIEKYDSIKEPKDAIEFFKVMPLHLLTVRKSEQDELTAISLFNPDDEITESNFISNIEKNPLFKSSNKSPMEFFKSVVFNNINYFVEDLLNESQHAVNVNNYYSDVALQENINFLTNQIEELTRLSQNGEPKTSEQSALLEKLIAFRKQQLEYLQKEAPQVKYMERMASLIEDLHYTRQNPSHQDILEYKKQLYIKQGIDPKYLEEKLTFLSNAKAGSSGKGYSSLDPSPVDEFNLLRGKNKFDATILQIQNDINNVKFEDSPKDTTDYSTLADLSSEISTETASIFDFEKAKTNILTISKAIKMPYNAFDFNLAIAQFNREFEIEQKRFSKPKEKFVFTSKKMNTLYNEMTGRTMKYTLDHTAYFEVSQFAPSIKRSQFLLLWREATILFNELNKMVDIKLPPEATTNRFQNDAVGRDINKDLQNIFIEAFEAYLKYSPELYKQVFTQNGNKYEVNRELLFSQNFKNEVDQYYAKRKGGSYYHKVIKDLYILYDSITPENLLNNDTYYSIRDSIDKLKADLDDIPGEKFDLMKETLMFERGKFFLAEAANNKLAEENKMKEALEQKMRKIMEREEYLQSTIKNSQNIVTTLKTLISDPNLLPDEKNILSKYLESVESQDPATLPKIVIVSPDPEVDLTTIPYEELTDLQKFNYVQQWLTEGTKINAVYKLHKQLEQNTKDLRNLKSSLKHYLRYMNSQDKALVGRLLANDASPDWNQFLIDNPNFLEKENISNVVDNDILNSDFIAYEKIFKAKKEVEIALQVHAGEVEKIKQIERWYGHKIENVQNGADVQIKTLEFAKQDLLRQLKKIYPNLDSEKYATLKTQLLQGVSEPQNVISNHNPEQYPSTVKPEVDAITASLLECNNALEELKVINPAAAEQAELELQSTIQNADTSALEGSFINIPTPESIAKKREEQEKMRMPEMNQEALTKYLNSKDTIDKLIAGLPEADRNVITTYLKQNTQFGYPILSLEKFLQKHPEGMAIMEKLPKADQAKIFDAIRTNIEEKHNLYTNARTAEAQELARNLFNVNPQTANPTTGLKVKIATPQQEASAYQALPPSVASIDKGSDASNVESVKPASEKKPKSSFTRRVSQFFTGTKKHDSDAKDNRRTGGGGGASCSGTSNRYRRQLNNQCPELVTGEFDKNEKAYIENALRNEKLTQATAKTFSHQNVGTQTDSTDFEVRSTYSAASNAANNAMLSYIIAQTTFQALTAKKPEDAMQTILNTGAIISAPMAFNSLGNLISEEAGRIGGHALGPVLFLTAIYNAVEHKPETTREYIDTSLNVGGGAIFAGLDIAAMVGLETGPAGWIAFVAIESIQAGVNMGYAKIRLDEVLQQMDLSGSQKARELLAQFFTRSDSEYVTQTFEFREARARQLTEMLAKALQDAEFKKQFDEISVGLANVDIIKEENFKKKQGFTIGNTDEILPPKIRHELKKDKRADYWTNRCTLPGGNDGLTPFNVLYGNEEYPITEGRTSSGFSNAKTKLGQTSKKDPTDGRIIYTNHESTYYEKNPERCTNIPKQEGVGQVLTTMSLEKADYIGHKPPKPQNVFVQFQPESKKDIYNRADGSINNLVLYSYASVANITYTAASSNIQSQAQKGSIVHENSNTSKGSTVILTGAPKDIVLKGDPNDKVFKKLKNSLTVIASNVICPSSNITIVNDGPNYPRYVQASLGTEMTIVGNTEEMQFIDINGLANPQSASNEISISNGNEHAMIRVSTNVDSKITISDLSKKGAAGFILPHKVEDIESIEYSKNPGFVITEYIKKTSQQVDKITYIIKTKNPAQTIEYELEVGKNLQIFTQNGALIPMLPKVENIPYVETQSVEKAYFEVTDAKDEKAIQDIFHSVANDNIKLLKRGNIGRSATSAGINYYDIDNAASIISNDSPGGFHVNVDELGGTIVLNPKYVSKQDPQNQIIQINHKKLIDSTHIMLPNYPEGTFFLAEYQTRKLPQSDSSLPANEMTDLIITPILHNDFYPEFEDDVSRVRYAIQNTGTSFFVADEQNQELMNSLKQLVEYQKNDKNSAFEPIKIENINDAQALTFSTERGKYHNKYLQRDPSVAVSAFTDDIACANSNCKTLDDIVKSGHGGMISIDLRNYIDSSAIKFPFLVDPNVHTDIEYINTKDGIVMHLKNYNIKLFLFPINSGKQDDFFEIQFTGQASNKITMKDLRLIVAEAHPFYLNGMAHSDSTIIPAMMQDRINFYEPILPAHGNVTIDLEPNKLTYITLPKDAIMLNAKQLPSNAKTDTAKDLEINILYTNTEQQSTLRFKNYILPQDDNIPSSLLIQTQDGRFFEQINPNKAYHKKKASSPNTETTKRELPLQKKNMFKRDLLDADIPSDAEEEVRDDTLHNISPEEEQRILNNSSLSLFDKLTKIQFYPSEPSSEQDTLLKNIKNDLNDLQADAQAQADLKGQMMKFNYPELSNSLSENGLPNIGKLDMQSLNQTLQHEIDAFISKNPKYQNMGNEVISMLQQEIPKLQEIPSHSIWKDIFAGTVFGIAGGLYNPIKTFLPIAQGYQGLNEVAKINVVASLLIAGGAGITGFTLEALYQEIKRFYFFKDQYNSITNYVNSLNRSNITTIAESVAESELPSQLETIVESAISSELKTNNVSKLEDVQNMLNKNRNNDVPTNSAGSIAVNFIPAISSALHQGTQTISSALSKGSNAILNNINVALEYVPELPTLNDVNTALNNGYNKLPKFPTLIQVDPIKRAIGGSPLCDAESSSLDGTKTYYTKEGIYSERRTDTPEGKVVEQDYKKYRKNNRDLNARKEALKNFINPNANSQDNAGNDLEQALNRGGAISTTTVFPYTIENLRDLDLNRVLPSGEEIPHGNIDFIKIAGNEMKDFSEEVQNSLISSLALNMPEVFNLADLGYEKMQHISRMAMMGVMAWASNSFSPLPFAEIAVGAGKNLLLAKKGLNKESATSQAFNTTGNEEQSVAPEVLSKEEEECKKKIELATEYIMLLVFYGKPTAYILYYLATGNPYSAIKEALEVASGKVGRDIAKKVIENMGQIGQYSYEKINNAIDVKSTLEAATKQLPPHLQYQKTASRDVTKWKQYVSDEVESYHKIKKANEQDKEGERITELEAYIKNCDDAYNVECIERQLPLNLQNNKTSLTYIQDVQNYIYDKIAQSKNARNALMNDPEKLKNLDSKIEALENYMKVFNDSCNLEAAMSKLESYSQSDMANLILSYLKDMTERYADYKETVTQEPQRFSLLKKRIEELETYVINNSEAANQQLFQEIDVERFQAYVMDRIARHYKYTLSTVEEMDKLKYLKKINSCSIFCQNIYATITSKMQPLQLPETIKQDMFQKLFSLGEQKADTLYQLFNLPKYDPAIVEPKLDKIIDLEKNIVSNLKLIKDIYAEYQEIVQRYENANPEDQGIFSEFFGINNNIDEDILVKLWELSAEKLTAKNLKAKSKVEEIEREIHTIIYGNTNIQLSSLNLTQEMGEAENSRLTHNVEQPNDLRRRNVVVPESLVQSM